MPKSSLLLSLLLAATLLGMVGCVDKVGAGDTSGTRVYVFDNASGTVKIWDDALTLYTSTTTPSPTRVLTGGSISNRAPLGWGGLAVDTTANRLYLVSATGVVTRIERVSTQNGAITQASDISTFSLGDPGSDRFSSGSVFGQAAVNPGTGTLYVAESSADRVSTRIWVVPGAGSVTGNVPKSNAISGVVDDKGYGGVAPGQGSLFFSFFAGGDTIYDGLGQNPQDGARIRTGSGAFNYVIVGANTKLTDTATTYGSLAYDSGNNVLYVCREASSSSLPAVLVFTNSQLTGSILNPVPARNLGDTADQLPLLRFITHAGTKDWLAGGNVATGTGTNNLYLWKAPSAGGVATRISLDSAVQVAGIALDGSN
jgi:hypothetical protein